MSSTLLGRSAQVASVQQKQALLKMHSGSLSSTDSTAQLDEALRLVNETSMKCQINRPMVLALVSDSHMYKPSEKCQFDNVQKMNRKPDLTLPDRMPDVNKEMLSLLSIGSELADNKNVHKVKASPSLRLKKELLDLSALSEWQPTSTDDDYDLPKMKRRSPNDSDSAAAKVNSKTTSAGSPCSYMTAASDFHGSLESVRRGTQISAAKQQDRNIFGAAFRASFDNLRWHAGRQFFGTAVGNQPAPRNQSANILPQISTKSASSASLQHNNNIISKVWVNGGRSRQMSTENVEPTVATPIIPLGQTIRQPTNIEKAVNKIDKVLNRVKSLQQMPRKQANKQTSDRVTAAMAHLDRATENIRKESDQVAASGPQRLVNDRVYDTLPHYLPITKLMQPAQTVKSSSSIDAAIKSFANLMPSFARQMNGPNKANQLYVPQETNVMTSSTPEFHSNQTHYEEQKYEATAEETARLEFTRQWLKGDLKSWYDSGNKSTKPTVSSPDQFERQRQFDQRSAGSASAEVAAITSNDAHRVRTPKKHHLQVNILTTRVYIVVVICTD
jgi:hypothetical protein